MPSGAAAARLRAVTTAVTAAPAASAAATPAAPAHQPATPAAAIARASLAAYHPGILAPQHRAVPPARSHPSSGTFSPGRSARPHAQRDLPSRLCRRGTRSTTTHANDASTPPSSTPVSAQYHAGRSPAGSSPAPSTSAPITRRPGRPGLRQRRCLSRATHGSRQAHARARARTSTRSAHCCPAGRE